MRFCCKFIVLYCKFRYEQHNCSPAHCHVMSDGPYYAAATSEPKASLSACLFGRATVPIPATLVLSHTQSWLPEHQLESCKELSAESHHCRLELNKFKFSPVTSVLELWYTSRLATCQQS